MASRFGTASIGLGELAVTGTLNTFFDDITILDDVLTDGFRTAIEYALRSGDGRAVLTDIPEVAFSSGAPDVPGKNQDVTIPIGFQGLRDPTLGYTIIYWSNVVRPGHQMDLDVNEDLLPPPEDPVTGVRRPAFSFDTTDYWVQGINVGAEYRW